jgi:hypothetical protein
MFANKTVVKFSSAVLLAMTSVSGVLAPPVAQADPLAPYIYYCAQVDGDSVIAFSQIWTCSSPGPDFVNKYSRYTGNRVGWIDGDCANYAYRVLGWRDMQKIWNACLNHQMRP